MGPLLFAGLALFGSSTAIGSITAAARSSPGRGGVSLVRRLGVVLVAHAAGAGLLGAVVGLLAVTTGRIHDASLAPVTAVLAILGGTVAGARILRADADLDPHVVRMAVLTLGSHMSLGVIIVILANVIAAEPIGSPADAQFIVLGTITALASIGLGVTGARSMRLAGEIVNPEDEAIIRRMYAIAVARTFPFEVASIVAAAIAIAIVLTS